MRYTVYNSELEAQLAQLDSKELKRFVFLEPHPEFKNNFHLQSFDPFYIRLFYELIGDYQALSIWKLPALFELCEEIEYEVVFMQDPAPLFEWLDHLDDPYPGELGLELKKFQTQGFNFLRDNRADIVDWSTGTGKSVFACAKARYLLEQGHVDKVVVVAKAHARIGWLRQLRAVASLDADLVGFYDNGKRLVERSAKSDDELTGAEKLRAFRQTQYASQVFIINYEKMKHDEKELTKALRKQRVYFVWDEMPTKLKTESSALYRATRRVVKSTRKTGATFHSMLSATAIENIPEDVYYCIRMMDENALPETVAMFRNNYGRTRSYFDPTKVALWDTQKLQELGLRLAHMTHKASKYTDPEIAAQFPVEQWEDIPVQMSSQDYALYSDVQKEIMSEFWDGVNLDPIIAKMVVLQLVCNNPAWIALSDGALAHKIMHKGTPSDKHCEKLKVFRDLVEQIDGKIVTFTRFNDLGAKPLSRYLKEWEIPHVLHDGSTTLKQAAIDRFQSDPNIKVFLSSDQGSDSINLDAGSSVINYDFPWKYSTLVQRVNRVNRITSLGQGIMNVYYYNLVVAGTLEERIQMILNRKKSYLEAFGAAGAEQSEGIAQLTRGDLWFILTGLSVDVTS